MLRRSTTPILKLFLTPAVLAVLLLATIAASASTAVAGGSGPKAAVPQALLDAAKAKGSASFDVLVQGDASFRGPKLADRAAKALGKGQTAKSLGASLRAQFGNLGSIELTVSGKEVLDLAKQQGIVSIVPNAKVAMDGLDNSQKWDDATGAKWFWASSNAKAKAPTIAIVDSGVSNANNAFGSRLLGQFDLGGGSASGDPRGHGTFVAQLAAGAADKFAGTAPNATILSLDVFDAQGKGTTANVMRAVDWILQHRTEYNIRVANFSLQTTQKSSFLYDPLDLAVEQLWRAGIVVTAAAGNYGENGQPSGVLYAPGNDPFVITVGAADIKASNDQKDDGAAPWSSYGYTPDGFAKPELSAPGRYLTEPIPLGATLYADYPKNSVKTGQLQLSGTSFASPIVAGMAAALLGAHPDWTPDNVKGALMVSAVPGKAGANALGVGSANLQKAFSVTNPPNPNAALNGFLVPDPAGGPLPVFDGGSWIDAASNNPAWNSASWSSASWSSASWSSASWSSASWSSASWSSVSWNSASWSSDSATDATNNAKDDGTNLNY